MRAGRGIAVPLVLVAASMLPACKFVGTRAHNLSELHDEAGRHTRTGAVLSDFEYGWLMGIAAAVPGVAAREAEVKKIPKPLEACVSNLHELNSFDSDDPRTAALQVHILAWLAVEDPWKLSRAEAVHALGAHGQRLELTLTPEVTGEPAEVEQVRDAIARLVNAMQSTVNPDQVDPDAPEDDIESACAHIDSMALDRAGGLRLLRASTVLEAQVSKRDRRIDPLRASIVRLQRICVREALREALLDRAPRPGGGSHPGWDSDFVRATAVAACVRAFGDPALGEMLLALDRERSAAVLAAVLNQVARHGLPEVPAGLSEESEEQLRERWIELVMLQASDNPEGFVRVAAMGALGTISGGEVRSLREEDWQAWLVARRQSEGN